MRVIIAAGGSGGHIFPAVALAEELEKKGVGDISIVASQRRLDKNLLRGCGFRAFFLSINPMPFGRNPLKWAVFISKVIYDAVRSVWLLLWLRPDVVVGFGGYSSGTITRCAKFFGLPLVIHEQNFVPGRANVILGKHADLIAVSFRGTEDFFPSSQDKIVFTGNPIRKEMISGVRDTGIERFGLESNRFTVLVMGGSQGSSGINKIASEAAGILNEKRPGKFQFIHLTGTRDLDEVKKFYKERAIKACVFSFLEKMELAYACSDFAVSRSGAAAIFELAFYSIPMILVPYPNARNNQRTNAVYFSQKGAALYREEHELTAEKLARDVSEMFSDDAKRRELSQRSNALAKPDAGTCLADEVIKLVKTRG